MRNDTRRITLIVRHIAKSGRDWDSSNPRGNRLIFIDRMSFLPFALQQGVEGGQDVERVIIDRAGKAEEYLELIASLPRGFLGDVLLVCEDGRGFLSSAGRGDGRVLYSMTNQDVDFYLQTHHLLWRSFPGQRQEERLSIA